MDIGGTKVLGVSVRDGEVAATERLDTVHDRAALLASVRDLADELDPTGPVGLGVAGFVSNTGLVMSSPNVPCLAGMSATEAADALGRPVRLGNDANCAARAEWQLGAGTGADSVALVAIGTGIGAGFVIDGRVLGGHGGFAGEIGHMVVDPGGPACPCGQRGCWERLASGNALDRAARRGLDEGWLPAGSGPGQRPTGGNLIAAARSGCVPAGQALDAWARWVAVGMVNVLNLFDPELVVLAGGLADAADVVLPPVLTWRDRLWNGADTRIAPPLVTGQLGARAGAIGAALLAREN